MASSQDLVEALSRLGLSRQRPTSTEDHYQEDITTYPRRLPHHEIRFDFPALDLVQNETQVLLPEPTDVDARPQPDASTYQLHQYPSEYCHIMAPAAVQPDLELLGADDNNNNDNVSVLLTVLDSLASHEGESTIAVATYILQGQMRFRLRLQSLVEGRRNVFESEFDERDFTILLSAQRPWISLLGDVVYRSSTRSYIAAEISMMAADKGFHARDHARWLERWDSRRGCCSDSYVVTRGQQVDVESYDEGGHIVKLPCGHNIEATVQEMQALHEDHRTRLRCTDCDDQASWESLDGKVGRSEPEALSTQALLGILIATLRSFEVPDSIMPAMVQLALCEETLRARDVLCAWLVTQHDLITIVPADLHAGLVAVCLEGLRVDFEALETTKTTTTMVPTPPGWTRFIHLWLCRSINFLIHRRCLVQGSEAHEGVHWHTDDNLIWWSDPRRISCLTQSNSEQDLGVYDVLMT